MIELSTPLLPGLPTGMRPAGVSLGMTSDFALALAQISAPAEAAPTPDVAAPLDALPQATAMPDRQIAAVAGNVLPVAVAFEVSPVPVDASITLDATIASGPLDALPSTALDTPAECGAERILPVLTKRAAQPRSDPALKVVAPSLPKPALAEVAPVKGETPISPVSVTGRDPQVAADDATTKPTRARESDAPITGPVRTRTPKGAKPDPLPSVVLPAIPVAASAATAAPDTASAKPKREDTASSESPDTPAPPVGIAIPVPVDPVAAPAITAIEPKRVQTDTPAGISPDATPEPKRGSDKEAPAIVKAEAQAGQAPLDPPVAATPNVATPGDAIVASTTPRARVDRIVARGATVAVPLPRSGLPTARPRPGAPAVVDSATPRLAPATVAAHPATLEAMRSKDSAQAAPVDATPVDVPVSASQSAATATVPPSVSGTAPSVGSEPISVVSDRRAVNEAAPATVAIDRAPAAAPTVAVNAARDAAPAPAISAVSNPDTTPAPALAPEVEIAATRASAPAGPAEPPSGVTVQSAKRTSVEPTTGVANEVPAAPQSANVATPALPAAGEPLRAVRMPSRAAVDAPAVTEAASHTPAAVPAPTVQPAAQAFAAAMFAAEPALRPTPRTRSTDKVEPLPIDAMLSAAPTTPHGTVQPIADTKAPPLDLTRQDWMASMIDRIETIRDESGGRETRIRLAPDALGTIDLSLRHDEHGELKVHIAAETPQARAILAEAAPRLTDMAEARGLKLGGSFIDAGTSGGDSRRDPQRAEAQQSQRPASARGREADTTNTSDSRIA